jgi:hypothetical protein
VSASYAVKPRFQLSVRGLQFSPLRFERNARAAQTLDSLRSPALSVENLCTNSAFAVDGLSSEIFFQDDAAETCARRYRDVTFVNGFA